MRFKAVTFVLLAAILVFTGCLRICEERITIRHDPDADTLTVLIHYDGIHDSGDPRWGDGAAQLPQFIANDGVMLLDWVFQVQLAEIRGLATNQDVTPELRAVGQAVAEQVKVQAVGYYRDSLGRIGGAQMVTITKAGTFLRAVNAALNAHLRAEGLGDGMAADYPGTHERILRAVQNEHQWVRLEGHAVQVSVPVQPREWAAVKAKGACDFVQEFVTKYVDSPAGRPKQLATVAKVASMLADVPFSYSESGGIVSMRIGDPAEPTAIRLQTLYEYQPNLEAEVIKHGKIDVDGPVARHLAGGQVETAIAYAAAVAEWGPEEERVRAMARAVEFEDAALSQAAFGWLNKFRIGWNHEHNLPVMPVPAAGEEPAVFARSCLEWCREMRTFPDPQ